MDHPTLFSRRNVEPNEKTDFRPDAPDGTSPFAQLRRLSAYLKTDIAPAADITDCDEALSYLREYSYRKIFTGTSHSEYIALTESDPAAIDWLIAVHYADVANFQSRKQSR